MNSAHRLFEDMTSGELYAATWAMNLFAVSLQVGAVWLIFYVYRRDKRSAAFLAGFTVLFLIASFLEGGAEFARHRSAFLFPPIIHFTGQALASLLGFVAMTSLALWLFSLTKQRFDASNESSKRHFDEFINAMFSSDRFLLAANQALPRHEVDAEHGLDWIPWILENIERKRRQFKKSANLFLSLTIFVGLIFSMIVVFYGYILINDAAAGSARELALIEHHLSVMNESVADLAQYRFDNPNFQRNCVPKLDALSKAKLSEKNSGASTKIEEAISSFRKGGPIYDLASTLQTVVGELKSDEESKGYFDALADAEQSVREFVKGSELLVHRFDVSEKELNRLLPDIQKSLERQDVRLVELLKRFAVGLVVTTFLFGILKYLALLYRDHYEEMVTAQREEIEVRRYYIAFKGSEGNSKERNAIAQAFIQGAKAQSPDSGDTKKESKENAEVIKELASLLSKKLG